MLDLFHCPNQNVRDFVVILVILLYHVILYEVWADGAICCILLTLQLMQIPKNRHLSSLTTSFSFICPACVFSFLHAINFCSASLL